MTVLTLPLYEIAGYLALVFGLLSFSSRDATKIRIHGFVASALFAVNFYYHDGLNGAFVSAISAVSKILSLTLTTRQLTIVKVMSPFLALLFFMKFNTNGLAGLLPALILVIVVFTDARQDLLEMKILHAVMIGIWTIYSIVIWSVPAMLFDIACLGMLLYGILSIRRERKLATQTA